MQSRGEQFARSLDCGFIMTSARTGYNTHEAFEEVCRMILIAQGHIPPDPTHNHVTSRLITEPNALTQSMRLTAD